MINKGLKVAITFIAMLFTNIVHCTDGPLSLIQPDKAALLEHIKTLSSDQFLGRKFASEGAKKSQSYLITTLEALSVPAFERRYRHPFTKSGLFTSQQGTNIIAFIPGTHFKDDYIVLSAHYDHLGIRGRKVYNGADDNASGTAALLHYAEALIGKPLKHSVILLFTDGEESDLLGAKAFIAQQQSLVKKIKLNINLDMIAGSKRTKKLHFISKDLDQILSIKAQTSFTQLQSYYKENSSVRLTHGFRVAQSRNSSINRRGINWRMASDHGVFSKAGIPFIYFGVGPHKNYHSEFDDYENINRSFYLAATDIIFQQLVFLDDAMSREVNFLASDVVNNS